VPRCPDGIEEWFGKSGACLGPNPTITKRKQRRYKK
jgi:hypothetical protein